MIVKQTYTVPLIRKASFDSHPITHIASFSNEAPSIYSIEHKTVYTYSKFVNHSKHLFRLQPVHDLSQQILSYKFSVSVPGADVSNFTGVFGNHASFLEIKEDYKELTILSESIVAISPIPMKLDLVHQPRTIPLIWMPWDRTMMNAYLQPPELAESELFELSNYAMSFVEKNKNDAFEVLKDINNTIYKEYKYKPNATDLETTAYEVFFHKQGVCQDFANLFICLARLLDIPARYRVGYLYTGSKYENKIQADESHAWVEVFLPYLGWIGFDPTNGCMIEKDHIRVACGRFYRDATPTSGAIFEMEEDAIESLKTSVKVIRLNQNS
jgi:transglutaminase-like putative cysteine protease